MLLESTLPVYGALSAAGVTCWLIGGNAVELLCGHHVRDHDDLDFLIPASQGVQARTALERDGFHHAHGSLEAGNVFFRRGDLLVDLVPVTPDPPRMLGELSRMVWPGHFLDEWWVELEGLRVLTLSPAMHRLMKDTVSAYYRVELREKDRLDLAALATLDT